MKLWFRHMATTIPQVLLIHQLSYYTISRPAHSILSPVKFSLVHQMANIALTLSREIGIDMYFLFVDTILMSKLCA